MNKDIIHIDHFIKHEIRPILQNIDNERRQLIESGKKQRVMAIPVVSIGLVYVFIEALGWAETIVGALPIFLPIAVAVFSMLFTIKPHQFVASKVKRSLVRQFKNEAIRASVLQIDPTLIYIPLFRTKKQQIERSELFPSVTEHKEDDGITGEFDGVKFKMSEVHLMNGLRNSFNGLFVQLVFPEQLSDEICSVSQRPQEEGERLRMILDGFYEKTQRQIKLSCKGRELFMAIPVEQPLFNFNFNKVDYDEVIHDIQLLKETITLAKTIVRLLHNK